MNTLQNWNFIFLNVTIVSIHHKKEHILNSHEITCCSKFVTSKLNKVHKMKLGLLKKLFSKSALRKLKQINGGKLKGAQNLTDLKKLMGGKLLGAQAPNNFYF